MKAILQLLFLLPFLLNAQDFPQKPSNYVTDETHSISQEDQTKLNTKLKAYEDSSSNQIFVYVAYSLNGKNLEQYSQDIFHNWHIGQGEKNNGVLIAVFVDDHKFRIQTGYGLEGALPDLLTKRIQDNDMRPLFKLNRYSEGIDKGIDQLIYYSKHEFKASENNEDIPIFGLFILFYSISFSFLLIILFITRSIKDNPKAKKNLNMISIILFIIPFLGSVLLVIMIFIVIFYRLSLSKKINSSSVRSSNYSSWSNIDNDNSSYSDSSTSSWSSSDSSSDSSSSFDGGGGGDSGGGGSSSDW